MCSSEPELKCTELSRPHPRPASASTSFDTVSHPFIPTYRLCVVCVVLCALCVMCWGRAQVRDKFNQQMDWDKHLSKKDLRRAEREQLAFLKVR